MGHIVMGATALVTYFGAGRRAWVPPPAYMESTQQVYTFLLEAYKMHPKDVVRQTRSLSGRLAEGEPTLYKHSVSPLAKKVRDLYARSTLVYECESKKGTLQRR